MDDLSSLLEDDLINPLKKERILMGVSTETLSKEAGIQLAAIGQAEEGFYPNPLPAYLVAVGIRPGSLAETKITEEYKSFQVKRRKLNGPSGKPKLILNPIFSLDEHPLVTWRRQSGLATYGFCSAFCIHMPSVNHFEKNILTINTIPPKPISESLTDAGYDLDEFTEACILYKYSLANSIRELNNLPPIQLRDLAS